MIPIISVIGTKGTGKTTVMEYLISNFSKQGLRVASIKHVHHPTFSIDSPGTDTWRHAEAGAKVIMSVGPKEIAVVKKLDTTHYPLDKILDLIKGEGLDIILIEGFHSLIAKRNDIYKIITANDANDLARTLPRTDPPILAVTGSITQQRPKPRTAGLPMIDLDREGKQLLQLIETQVISKFKIKSH